MKLKNFNVTNEEDREEVDGWFENEKKLLI
jgi:hypothetical protein